MQASQDIPLYPLYSRIASAIRDSMKSDWQIQSGEPTSSYTPYIKFVVSSDPRIVVANTRDGYIATAAGETIAGEQARVLYKQATQALQPFMDRINWQAREWVGTLMQNAVVTAPNRTWLSTTNGNETTYTTRAGRTEICARAEIGYFEFLGTYNLEFRYSALTFNQEGTLFLRTETFEGGRKLAYDVWHAARAASQSYSGESPTLRPSA
jgi:hypothetical protein